MDFKEVLNAASRAETYKLTYKFLVDLSRFYDLRDIRLRLPQPFSEPAHAQFGGESAPAL